MSKQTHRHRERPHQLRRPRFLPLSAALLRQVDGLFPRHAGKAGGRHRLYAVRLQQLPPAFPRIAGGGEARRAGGRRAADGIPHHFARRGVPQSDQPEIPQSDVDRHRGNGARAADGCGGADGRLRQDRAGAAHGRGVGRQAGDHAGGRADDDRPSSRRAAGRLHRLPPVLGEISRRQDRRRGNFRGRRQARHHRRHLRGDGHRLDHGLHRRSARHDPARHRCHSRRACRPPARGGSNRRRCGQADRLEAHARHDRQSEVGGERVARAARDRRLDQCDHPSHGDCRPRRHSGVAATAQRIVRHHAGAGEPEAGRQRLHGRLLRRRRHGRADARIEGPAASRLS